MGRKPLHMPFIEQALAQDTDECIVWPFTTNNGGYGTTTVLGKTTTAHRVVALLAHGPAPFEESQAAHACHNRPCINPRHISWASPAENINQSFVAGRLHARGGPGETNPNAKLTKQDIYRIFDLRFSMTQREIGALFGVHHATISKILSGKKWRSVSNIQQGEDSARI